jgi:hypothetical protein
MNSSRLRLILPGLVTIETCGPGARPLLAGRTAFAGISTFDLSRYVGASLTMIDRHYGHLARGGREHTIRLLDELSASEPSTVALVDAGRTLTPAGAASSANESIS